jgi:hypothetical protein
MLSTADVVNKPLAKSDFAIAQLLYFNSHKKGTKNTREHSRHSRNRKPPFAIYVGLLLYCRIGGFGFDFKNAGFTFVYVSERQLIAFDFGF